MQVEETSKQHLTINTLKGLFQYNMLPFGIKTAPYINQLLEKDHKWEWYHRCEDAFKEAKRLVTSEQVLAHYDPDLPVRVACDASQYSLGAVLSNVMSDGSETYVAFASRTLDRAERNYSQIDKEALTLVWGIWKFNHYLYSGWFTLVTDHQPFDAIFHPSQMGVVSTV